MQRQWLKRIKTKNRKVDYTVSPKSGVTQQSSISKLPLSKGRTVTSLTYRWLISPTVLAQPRQVGSLRLPTTKTRRKQERKFQIRGFRLIPCFRVSFAE